jgi:hypothetical protein
MTGNWTEWDFGDVDHDMFTFFATEDFGNYSVVRIEQKTGDPSDGDLLSLVVADDEANVDQLVIGNGTAHHEITRLVGGGSITRTLTSDADEQWIFTTAGTGGPSTADGIFEIIVGGTPTADTDIFNVVKGTTTLFSVDEDGDVSFAGALTDGTATLDGSGAWTGIASITASGAVAVTGGPLTGPINVNATPGSVANFYGTYTVTGNADIDLVLDSAVVGMSICIRQGQGRTDAITVTAADGDYIVMDGVRGTVENADQASKLTSSAGATDRLCLVAVTADDWYGDYVGTWAEI